MFYVHAFVVRVHLNYVFFLSVRYLSLLPVLLKPKLLKRALKFCVVNINVHPTHSSLIVVLRFR